MIALRSSKSSRVCLVPDSEPKDRVDRRESRPRYVSSNTVVCRCGADVHNRSDGVRVIFARSLARRQHQYAQLGSRLRLHRQHNVSLLDRRSV